MMAGERMLKWATGLAAPLTAAAAGVLFSGVAAADQVTLVAVRDTTLIQAPPDTPLGNGGDDNIFAGRTNQGDGADRRRALLAFDLSSIPVGSTVTGASVSLYHNRSRGGSRVVRLHRMTTNWGEGTVAGGSGGGGGWPAGEGDATWYCPFYPTTLWTTPGGDYAATASASTTVGATGVTYTWTSAALAADVQGWLNNPAGNYGWIVIGDESAGQTAQRFTSRNSTAVSQRPRLTVTYTPPSSVGACCLPTGCQVNSQTQCVAQGGTYLGDGVPCSPYPCPEPLGACCFTNGTCQSLTSAACAQAGGTYQGAGVACAPGLCAPVIVKYVDPLPRPSVAQPLVGTPGSAATYRLTINEFVQRLHRDLPPTRVWGFNGLYPGPTIEASTGQQVVVSWANDLREPSGALRTTHYLPVDPCLHGPDVLGPSPRTVVHLHGGHVSAASDGYPESTILPGQEVTYTYPNNQAPATLWYHDHALGITRLNVYMGLAGFYLLRDSAEAGLGLPSGEYEVPMAIQDRTLNADGTLSYPATWTEHFFGDTILVNGKVWPFMNVRQGKYRLRLLNGSNSRVYTLSLSNGLVFRQIGTDGGLLPAPVTLETVTIGPGERADVVVDFAGLAGGTEVYLTNSAPAPYPGEPGVGVVAEVMKFVVQPLAGHTAPLPAALRPVAPIDPRRVARERSFTLQFDTADPCAGGTWTINGLMWDDITEVVRLGSVEVWSFVNRSEMAHPMHLHLVSFQILDRQEFQVIGGQVVPVGPRVPPAAHEAGWKDTVLVMPGQIVRIAARFDDHAGLFPYHCHTLEHEDHEMMRQFRTVCQTDWDTNGRIDPSDVASFVNDWYRDTSAGTLVSDVSGNGTVDPVDVSVFVNRWLTSVIFGGC
jgi:spore coat protein A